MPVFLNSTSRANFLMFWSEPREPFSWHCVISFLEHFKRMWLFTMDTITGNAVLLPYFCFSYYALIVSLCFSYSWCVLSYAPYPYCCSHVFDFYCGSYVIAIFSVGCMVDYTSDFYSVYILSMFLDNYIDILCNFYVKCNFHAAYISFLCSFYFMVFWLRHEIWTCLLLNGL